MRNRLGIGWQRWLIPYLYAWAMVATSPSSLAQSSSSSSIVTTVDLPLGEINVLVLTDVHSWVGGHSSSSTTTSISSPESATVNDVDYGDVLSFYQRLHTHCHHHEMDLWFVVNGDWIDGTGLSMNSDTSYLTPILEHMPWDALNVGNHELYRDQVITEFMRPGGFVEWWGDRYVSSNVLYTERQQPLGERYRFLRGRNSTLLTFGFLYNMDDASKLVTVETVESVVEAQWFIDVVTNAYQDPNGEYDAILIMAHMGVKDDLVTVLLQKIRALVGDNMPVQFLTGHTHFRRVETLDPASVSFEAGKFLDTIGFVSFPKKQTLANHNNNRQRRILQDGSNDTSIPLLGPEGTEWQNVSESTPPENVNTTTATSAPASLAPTDATTPLPTIPPTPNATVPISTPQPTMAPTPIVAEHFHHRFIDTSVEVLVNILGGVTEEEFVTEDGRRLSEFILRTRKELGLLDLVGCSPESYYMNRSSTDEDSLWRLFIEQVAPYDLLKPPASKTNPPLRIFIAGAFAFRYDVLQRQLVKDDVIAVAPFNDTILSVGPRIPGSVVAELVTKVLNPKPNDYNPRWDNYYLSPRLEDIQPDGVYEILTPTFGVQAITSGLEVIGYNGTVKQEESGYSDTDVWLKFVQDNWACHEEQSSSQHGNHHNQGSHGGGGSSGSNNQQGGGSSSTGSGSHGHGDHNSHHAGSAYHPDAAEDRFRLILASIGVGLVLLLGTLYIWQLHKSWLVRYRERQRLIFIADSENDPDNELI